MNKELRRCGAQLLALQEVDRVRSDNAERLENLPQKRTIMALRAKREEGARHVTTINDRVAGLKQKEAILDVDLAAVETRIIDEQKKIDATTDHREVTRLTQSLDLLSRRKDDIENESLELLEAQQKLERTRVDTEEKIAALLEREQAEIAAWKALAGALKAELAASDAKHAQIAATLPGDLRARYDELAELKGGVVVARFQKGRCLGCRVAPPTADRARIETSDRIERCPHCHRLLVTEGADV